MKQSGLSNRFDFAYTYHNDISSFIMMRGQPLLGFLGSKLHSLMHKDEQTSGQVSMNPCSWA